MKKGNKIIIFGVICVIVIIGIIVSYKKNNTNNLTKIENMNNTVVENNNENIVSNNMTNGISDDIENNTVTTYENILEEKNEIVEEVNTSYQSKDIYEKNDNVGTTNKKEEAINMVKQMWGEDDTVKFRCDSITSNGEYIVAVYSVKEAIVKNYFKVNLETKKVEVDY